MAGVCKFLLLIALGFVFANASRHFQKHLLTNSVTDFDFDSSEERIDEDDPQKSFVFGNYRTMTVCVDSDSGVLRTVEGDQCDNGAVKAAVGKYQNAVNQTGWGILEIETFDSFADEVQAYAAGILEGRLVHLQISYHIQNTVADICVNHTDFCKRLHRYLNRNLEWIRSQVLENPQSNIYWRQVNLTFTQLTGVYDGYTRPLDYAKFRPAVAFKLSDILMIQLSGELFDLNKFLHKDPDLNDDPEPGKCSGFVKLAEGNKDILMSHVAMSGYNTMNRVLKLYKFAFDKSKVPGHTYSFSGYPGALASADDYTLVSSGLLSIETTIAVFNNTLYTDRYIKPEGQLHCWVRSTISNQLARSAKEWTDIFSLHNSGTYNNQWTVLDYKKFKPGQELPNHDVLWVLEQVPGYIVSKDVTWFLRKYGYWPSYNIPYLTKISKLSMFDQKGNENNWWRWGYCPRARIFDRDHHKVKDLDTLVALMRYNDYTHEPFSRCSCNPPYSAEASISTRGDLNPASGTYEVAGMGHRNHGSLDYKGTNYENFKKLRIQAIGGPTYDPLPPFDWRTTDIDAKHEGQPKLWKFRPFITEWQTPVEVDL